MRRQMRTMQRQGGQQRQPATTQSRKRVDVPGRQDVAALGSISARARPVPDRAGHRDDRVDRGTAHAAKDALDADRRIQQYGLLT